MCHMEIAMVTKYSSKYSHPNATLCGYGNNILKAVTDHFSKQFIDLFGKQCTTSDGSLYSYSMPKMHIRSRFHK